MTFDEACQAFQDKRRSSFVEASAAVIKCATHTLSTPQIALLAKSIANSGLKYDLPMALGPFADVASTGAPGSLSTILCPLLIASVGLRVPKVSVTGSIAGGIDTFSIIPGFRATLSFPEFIGCLRSVGFAHVTPSERICEADRFLIQGRRKAGLMGNAALAAASLLAKKLAVPGTAACFDFRVGPTGNVGADLQRARESARVFSDVARELRLSIGMVLTDNTVFPCAAIGRLESLHLLWSIVEKAPTLRLNLSHLQTCIRLAAVACALAKKSTDIATFESQIHNALLSGQAREVLARHLEVQGSSLDQLLTVLKARNSQHQICLRAVGSGFWFPPDLELVKDWIKARQAILDRGMKSEEFQRQIGISLLTEPGSAVSTGDVVAEIRTPVEIDDDSIPQWLCGEIRSTPLPVSKSILDEILLEEQPNASDESQ